MLKKGGDNLEKERSLISFVFLNFLNQKISLRGRIKNEEHEKNIVNRFDFDFLFDVSSG